MKFVRMRDIHDINALLIVGISIATCALWVLVAFEVLPKEVPLIGNIAQFYFAIERHRDFKKVES